MLFTARFIFSSHVRIRLTWAVAEGSAGRALAAGTAIQRAAANAALRWRVETVANTDSLFASRNQAAGGRKPAAALTPRGQGCPALDRAIGKDWFDMGNLEPVQIDQE
jgi:hypothetical protein